jgi:hypothetical protein
LSQTRCAGARFVLLPLQVDWTGWVTTTQSRNLSSATAGPIGHDGRPPPRASSSMLTPLPTHQRLCMSHSNTSVCPMLKTTLNLQNKCHANVISGLKKQCHVSISERQSQARVSPETAVQRGVAALGRPRQSRYPQWRVHTSPLTSHCTCAYRRMRVFYLAMRNGSR